MVVPLDASLRAAASGIATRLRRAGRRVDLVLEAKKMKWAFKVGAQHTIISFFAVDYLHVKKHIGLDRRRVDLVLGAFRVRERPHGVFAALVQQHRFGVDTALPVTAWRRVEPTLETDTEFLRAMLLVAKQYIQRHGFPYRLTNTY